MKNIELPLVDAATTLNEAFEQLELASRSALAIRVGGGVQIITAPQIIRGAVEGLVRIGEIAPASIEEIVSASDATAKRRRRQQSALRSQTIAPVIVELKRGSAVLSITGSLRAMLLSAPSRCSCTNPITPHNNYLPKDDGTICKRCDYPVRCLFG